MEQYGIDVQTRGSLGGARYRIDGTDEWDFADAEKLAYGLLIERRVKFVTFGNGEHEFRMWGDDVTDFADYGNFTHPGGRWAQWYVDVEINEHRWRYRPVADLENYEDADTIAGLAAGQPEITRIWIGESDGGEFEWDMYGDRG